LQITINYQVLASLGDIPKHRTSSRQCGGNEVTCQYRQETCFSLVWTPETAAYFQAEPVVKEQHGMEAQQAWSHFDHDGQVHSQPYDMSQSVPHMTDIQDSKAAQKKVSRKKKPYFFPMKHEKQTIMLLYIYIYIERERERESWRNEPCCKRQWFWILVVHPPTATVQSSCSQMLLLVFSPLLLPHYNPPKSDSHIYIRK